MSFKKIILFILSVLLTTSLNADSLGFKAMKIDTNKEVSDFKKNKEKFSYKELISFLKNSNDKKKLMILGALYASDSKEPDSYGEYIKADPALAMKYLLKSYKLGESDALVVLSGLILYNDKMSVLDRDLSKIKQYLKQAKKEHVKSASLLLGITELLRSEYEEGISELVFAANKLNDSSAQLELALIFQKGIYSQKEGRTVVETDRNLAEYYLNKACTNEEKSDKVNEFCNSSRVIIK